MQRPDTGTIWAADGWRLEWDSEGVVMGGRVILGDARGMDLSQFGRYGVIVADPPWLYRVSKGDGVAENHYSTMTTADIMAMPVMQLAAANCMLFLWGTWPKLPEATQVMDAWGFEHLTGFPWIKTTKNGALCYGVGYWVRGCSEYVLVGRKGNVSPPDATDRYLGLLSPRMQHSRKPESVHKIVETLPGPYLELFARRPRDGWDVFGNDIKGIADMPLFVPQPEQLAMEV